MPDGIQHCGPPLSHLNGLFILAQILVRVHFLRGRMGTRNEGAGNKAPSYRERSQATDGRCESSHGKSSGSHHEDSLQPCGHRDRHEAGALLIDGPSPSGGYYSNDHGTRQTKAVTQMPQRQQKSGLCFSSISTRVIFCTNLYERNHWHGGGSA